MKIILNKSFESREELDNYVKNTFGGDVEKNRQITIEETPETLKRLLLSEQTTIYGVKVSATSSGDTVDDVNIDPALQNK